MKISIHYFVDLIFSNLPIKIYKLVILFKSSHNLISQCNYNLDEIFYSFCATFIILLYLLFVKYVIWWNFVAFVYKYQAYSTSLLLFGYLIKRKHNIRNTLPRLQYIQSNDVMYASIDLWNFRQRNKLFI